MTTGRINQVSFFFCVLAFGSSTAATTKTNAGREAAAAQPTPGFPAFFGGKFGVRKKEEASLLRHHHVQ